MTTTKKRVADIVVRGVVALEPPPTRHPPRSASRTSSRRVEQWRVVCSIIRILFTHTIVSTCLCTTYSFGRTRRRRRRRRPTRRSPTPTSRFQRRRHTRRARHAGRRPTRRQRRRRRRRTHGQVSRDDQRKRHPEPTEETTPHHHRFAVHRAVEPLRHPVRVRVRVRFVRCAPRRRGLRTLTLPSTGVRSIDRPFELPKP